jgi:hypothetical protein
VEVEREERERAVEVEGGVAGNVGGARCGRERGRMMTAKERRRAL